MNALFTRLRDRCPDPELGFHVHNLGGMATANMLAASGRRRGMAGRRDLRHRRGIAMPREPGRGGQFPERGHGPHDGADGPGLLAWTRKPCWRRRQDIAGLLDIPPRSYSMLRQHARSGHAMGTRSPARVPRMKRGRTAGRAGRFTPPRYVRGTSVVWVLAPAGIMADADFDDDALLVQVGPRDAQGSLAGLGLQGYAPFPASIARR